MKKPKAAKEKKTGKIKTRDLLQTVRFPNISPENIYEALMDSKKHAKLTGAPAKISRKVGGHFSAYGGSLRGRHLRLVKNRKIAQEWWIDEPEWPEGHRSKATFTLKPYKGGTLMKFEHQSIPSSAYGDIRRGWVEYYWTPMRKMLEK